MLSQSHEVSRVAKRRALTPARREQNRVSQARYRMKQSRIAAELELTQGVTPDGMSSSSSVEQVESANPPLSDATTQPTLVIPDEILPETWNTSSIPPSWLDVSDLPSVILGQFCDVSSPAEEGTANTCIGGLPWASQPFSSDPSSDYVNNHIPTNAWSMNNIHSGANQRTAVPSPAFLFTNHIRLYDMTFLAATMAIAASIDVTADDYLNDRPSPFYILSQATTIQLAASYFQQKVKPHLQPSLTQLSQLHASYLDLIIFPNFRERAVIFATTQPYLFDQQSLINDMMQGGLTCWGNAEGSITGRGGGVPWDMRSWEAKPWFLKKWWFLLGDNDEMQEISRWWWQIRGEDLDQPVQ